MHGTPCIGEPKLRDNLLIKLKENTTDVLINLLEEPAPVPLPNIVFWYKDGQYLSGSNQIGLTYSSVTFDTIRREDAGNYTVFAANPLSLVWPGYYSAGTDTGSFYLDVICNEIYYK